MKSNKTWTLGLIVILIIIILIIIGIINDISNKKQGAINYLLAIETNNSDYCENVPSKRFCDPDDKRLKCKLYSRGNCYHEVAYNTNDPSLCEKAGQSCYSRLGIKLKDPKLCAKTKDSEWDREICYNTLAEESDSLNECIDSGVISKYCYEVFAIKDNDKDLCENADELKDRCYSNYAFEKKDLEACERIEPDNGIIPERVNCIIAIAEELMDPELCEKVSEHKDLCLRKVDQRKILEESIKKFNRL